MKFAFKLHMDRNYALIFDKGVLNDVVNENNENPFANSLVNTPTMTFS